MPIVRLALSLIVLIPALLAVGQARVERAGEYGRLAVRNAPCHEAGRADGPAGPRSAGDCAHCLSCGVVATPPVVAFDSPALRVAFVARPIVVAVAAQAGGDAAQAHRARAPPGFA